VDGQEVLVVARWQGAGAAAVVAAGCTRAGGGAPAPSLLELKLSMMMSGVGVCRQESGRAEQYSIVQARDDSGTWQLLDYRYVAASNMFYWH
jgi:hypothetical protein